MICSRLNGLTLHFAKYFWAIFFLVFLKEGMTQHVVGVKSMRLYAVDRMQASNPDTVSTNAFERQYINVIPYYERYLDDHHYLVVMIEHERFEENGTDFIPSHSFGDNRWQIGLSTANFIRVDVGVGQVIDIDSRFTFKANVTLFYRRKYENNSRTKVEYYDDAGVFLGTFNSSSTGPPENSIGISLTPQLNYNFWRNFSVHFDLRYDLSSTFHKGYRVRDISLEDEFGNIIMESQSTTYSNEFNIVTMWNFGLGLSYRF